MEFKKIFSIGAAIFSIALGTLNAAEKLQFDGGQSVQFLNKSASIDSDSKALKMSSERMGWNPMMTFFKGKLKPNTAYTLRFNYKVEGKDVPDSYVQFYVREQVSQDPHKDYIKKEIPHSGDFKAERVTFNTDASAADFAIGISTHNPISCVAKDITLEEGTGEIFEAIRHDENSVKIDRATLPTGAKEFDVDLPRPKKEIVVNAADFGLSEDAENCASILNLALKHCKEIGASKLVLPTGKYKIFEEVAVQLREMSDFTLDGQGATLIYRKRNTNNMTISNCLRTKVCNLNMDWDWKTDPLASLVKVVNVEVGNFVDFQFYEYKNFPNKNVRVSNISSYDTKAKSVGIENGATLSYEMKRGLHKPPRTEWLDGNTLRVYQVSEKTPLKVGQHYRMQHSYYEMGGIAMNSNKHLTMENINIWSCSGQATRVGGEQQYWIFKNVNIVPPKGKKRRPISATADHCMIETSAGFFKMIDCDMGFGADDCINMHDNALYVTKSSKNSVRTKSARNPYLYNKGETFEFRKDNYAPANFLAKVVEMKVIDKQKGINEIVFDKEIPAPDDTAFILFNWRYNTHNVIIRNCYFHQNRARGILVIARDVTIENCRFYRNEMGAIKLETGYTFNSWSEGLGVNNVVIANCTFDTSNPLGVRNENYARDIFMGVYMRFDPSAIRTDYPIINNVLFENNKFKDTFGLVAFMSSCANVTFLNNTFENTTARAAECKYRGSFYASYTDNVRILNNTFVKSEFAKNIGVYKDADSAKNTVISGNKFVDSPAE